MDATARAAALRAHEADAATCERCGLAATRTQVVVGCGDAGATVMVVAEAPGFQEDRQGVPLAGLAGEFLDGLLEGAGVARDHVYVTSVLKCRLPGSRDPLPEEVAACEPHLFRQIETVRPIVVVALGTFATRVLSGRPDPITRVHGLPQELTVGTWTTTLLPLYHPAVALYTPAMLRTLEEDVARIPVLLGRAPREAVPSAPSPTSRADPGGEQAPAPAISGSAQLGLF